MNLTSGHARTTSGKGPTKRLLLTSNSCISFNFSKLLGMIPQNRLEFKWNKATSVIKPSSAGKCPAMSAPLRSTPATTVTSASSRAGAQTTPL
ncbi:hypothetical protein N665_0268s0064 [Sinapis alba]|nr:hypothetical protein N665_0268s0064 [Sinapis alba]